MVVDRARTGAESGALDSALDALARGLSFAVRSPVLRTPPDRGPKFQDVSFPSTDGTPLEAWFIPRDGSDELIVFQHPVHLTPKSVGASRKSQDRSPSAESLTDGGV